MTQPAHILVLHGPNLNLLGTREPEIYGTTTLDEINQELIRQAGDRNADVTCLQSNHEGQLVDWLHEYRSRAQGIIINPGALTHYGYSIHDAIGAVNIPTFEVHLTNIQTREAWRRKSVIAPATVGQIMGLGADSYYQALSRLLEHIRSG